MDENTGEPSSVAEFMRATFPDGDLFARCELFEAFVDRFKSSPAYSFYNVRHASKGVEVMLSLPRRPEPRLYVGFAGYDYLGLSFHPDVIAAAKRAEDEYGTSTTGSPPLSGKTYLHEQLEETLAALFRKEDALLFGSAFAANVGVLNALLRSNDFVLSDMLSHASIVDGMASCGARTHMFRHNNFRHADGILASLRPERGSVLIVSEGLFSMDGTVPDLKEMARVAKQHDARTLLDEAHSFMTIGSTGLGAVERHDAFDDIDLIIGSLSKTPGAGGGFVAGDHNVINWFRCFARPAMFSGGPSPSSVAAALEAIRIQRSHPELLDELRSNIRHFISGLANLGCRRQYDPESPIVPIIIGEQNTLGEINEVLLDEGIFTSPVLFPAVAQNSSRFRFTVTAKHTKGQLDRALGAFEKAFQLTGFHF